MNSLEGGSYYRITGDVRVCAPKDLRLMTPYVLTEQEDWFEDEIKFVRHLIQPGDVIVDVGANYGVYTLVSANGAGRDGQVIAFEPCSTTLKWLRESVSLNNFQQVTVIGKAVSDHAGMGSLATEANSELNRLDSAGDPARGEIVALTTLDDTLHTMALTRIDFIKIDAEGHEMKVIDGGHAFFTSMSPLVMIEIKAGDRVDLSPLGKLANLGYSPYTLVPGLNMLAPFDARKPIDGYLLNLFCCKPDRADLLSVRGLLVTQPNLENEAPDTDQWRPYIEQLAYAKAFMKEWLRSTNTLQQPGWENYRHTLNLYALSRNAALPIALRHGYLVQSYLQLAELTKTQGNFPRLLSYARIASEVGDRVVAVAALRQALEGMRVGNSVFIGEPFLSPAAAFEHFDPGENSANWVRASLLDAYESRRAFSSYFAPGDTAAIVSELKRLGYCSEAMDRRLRLASVRR